MAEMTGELVVISGRYRGQRVPVRQDALRIGRDRSCEIALDDEAASRIHSEIVRQGGQLILRDLKSTNGTFLNDARVTESPLQNGDRISVGDTVMLLQLESSDNGGEPRVVFTKDQQATATRLRISLKDTKFLELKEGTPIPEAQRQFVALYEFMVEIAGILHLPALLDRALDHFFRVFSSANRGLILLLTHEGDPGVKAARTRGGAADNSDIAISRTMARLLLQDKESFLSENVASDERLVGAESLHNIRVVSVMGAPLKVKDKIVGMVYFDTAAGGRPFHEEDLKLCSAMALQLAVCLENSRLYNELLDAAEFSNAILTGLKSGIVVLDTAGRVLRVNRATEETLNKKEAELLGRSLGEFPEFAELNRVIQRTLETGLAEDRYEVPVRVGSETIPLGLNTSALTDHTGKVIGAAANFRNLTSIRKLEEQVRRSQHLAALGQMAAGVAHEVRNPLNTIRGFAQLLQEDAKDSPKRGEFSQIILDEVDRMNRIVQDLLDFSRQRELTLLPANSRGLLEELVAEMQPDAQKTGVELKLLPGDTALPEVLGNTDKLRQVFRNIILNGLQACKAGGKVTLALSEREGESLVPGGTPGAEGAAPRRFVAVAVEDSGCGIEPVVMPRIFDPFFTQKDSGTGLGLSITQKIVEQHGGKLEVKSELGKGSVFTVVLPAV